jgi:VWFA-related protein
MPSSNTREKIMKTTRHIQVALIALLLLALFPAAASAQASIDLAIHYAEGTPLSEEIAYNVSVYLSVTGASGLPIRDLTLNDLTVAEDSQKIQAQSLKLVENDPIHLILVMDTSGSMTGTKIKDAKTAASNFVTRLQNSDQVALLTFDESLKLQTDFTSATDEILNRLALLDATPNSGTCLYDAAYRAIQTASTLPSGRRAVILFTDGVDETASGGRACSVHTIEDVISIASQGSTRTPIFTLGLGNRIDENALKRLAELTGGRYLYSPASSQLEAMFELLTEQLRYQYVLSYKSFTAPGAHTLTVNVNYLGAQDSDTRNFLLPGLPARINFLTPADGDSITDALKVTVAISGQSETIARVDFQVNGEIIGSDDTTPYELTLDLSRYAEGNLTLTAIAYGENNTELTRNTINLLHKKEVTPIPPTAAAEPAPLPAPEPQRGSPALVIGAVLAGLGLVAILLLGFIVIRQRKQEGTAEQTLPQVAAEAVHSVADADRTVDSFEGGPEALGALTVEASDDTSMIGLRFEISTSLTTLGRSASNDINFPRDNPVSRHHAEIFEKNNKLWLREVETIDSSGASAPPKYGTFLNDIPLGSNPAELKNGDEIRLGKRLRLRFETYARREEDDAKTFDELTLDDEDRTLDQP